MVRLLRSYHGEDWKRRENPRFISASDCQSRAEAKRFNRPFSVQIGEVASTALLERIQGLPRRAMSCSNAAQSVAALDGVGSGATRR